MQSGATSVSECYLGGWRHWSESEWARRSSTAESRRPIAQDDSPLGPCGLFSRSLSGRHLPARTAVDQLASWPRDGEQGESSLERGHPTPEIRDSSRRHLSGRGPRAKLGRSGSRPRPVGGSFSGSTPSARPCLPAYCRAGRRTWRRRAP